MLPAGLAGRLDRRLDSGAQWCTRAAHGSRLLLQVHGPVPVLCKSTVQAQLTDVFLRGTLLNGSLTDAFANCSELVSLSLQASGPGACARCQR